GANKVTGYATNLMATLQESLKASSGIDVKDLLENFSGKRNISVAAIKQENPEVNMDMAAGKEE
ncbi:flotillin family protein, partial [Peribacillus muralis]